MALPALITAADWIWQSNWPISKLGPYEYNGSLYFLLQAWPAADDLVRVYKSTDGLVGEAWAAVGTSGEPILSTTWFACSFDACQVADKIWVAYVSVDETAALMAFDCDTDTWGSAITGGPTVPKNGTFGVGKLNGSVGGREARIFYSYNPITSAHVLIHTTEVEDTEWVRFKLSYYASGAWTNNQAVYGESTSAHYFPAGLCISSTGRHHVFFGDNATGLWHISVSSTYVPGTAQKITDALDHSKGNLIGVSSCGLLGTTETVVVPFMSLLGGSQSAVICQTGIATDADVPTWAVQTVDIREPGDSAYPISGDVQSWCYSFFNAGKAYCTWIGIDYPDLVALSVNAGTGWSLCRVLTIESEVENRVSIYAGWVNGGVGYVTFMAVPNPQPLGVDVRPYYSWDAGDIPAADYNHGPNLTLACLDQELLPSVGETYEYDGYLYAVCGTNETFDPGPGRGTDASGGRVRIYRSADGVTWVRHASCDYNGGDAPISFLDGSVIHIYYESLSFNILLDLPPSIDHISFNIDTGVWSSSVKGPEWTRHGPGSAPSQRYGVRIGTVFHYFYLAGTNNISGPITHIAFDETLQVWDTPDGITASYGPGPPYATLASDGQIYLVWKSVQIEFGINRSWEFFAKWNPDTEVANIIQFHSYDLDFPDVGFPIQVVYFPTAGAFELDGELYIPAQANETTEPIWFLYKADDLATPTSFPDTVPLLNWVWPLYANPGDYDTSAYAQSLPGPQINGGTSAKVYFVTSAGPRLGFAGNYDVVNELRSLSYADGAWASTAERIYNGYHHWESVQDTYSRDDQFESLYLITNFSTGVPLADGTVLLWINLMTRSTTVAGWAFTPWYVIVAGDTPVEPPVEPPPGGQVILGTNDSMLVIDLSATRGGFF